MQSLASYGSDEESDNDSSTSLPVPIASTSKAPVAAVQSNHSLNPIPPVLNRLKSPSSSTSTSSSKHNSPKLLSGVLSTTNSRTNTPTSRNQTRKGGVSKSPPMTHARASTPRSTQNRADDERRDQEEQEEERDANRSTPRSMRRDEGETRSPMRRDDEGERNGMEEERPAAVDLNSLSRFGIPPIATGPCNPAVEAKLANFHSLRQSRGLHFNDSLSASKAFRNPRIYGKLVEFLDLKDESGNCWDKGVWSPREVGRDGNAQRIAELQKLKSEAKQAQVGQPSGRSSIGFTSSSSSNSTTKGGDIQSRYRERDEREKEKNGGTASKRSRWDNGAGSKRERSRSPHSSSSSRRR
ncbi:HCNGP domain-containing protein [Sporobolomyces salmoneus]|uniref:HCNGP domain-containing protein n=1 Tax=Sporobolomyces salmoneus TaxID=183962 RepID=UPI0031723F67